VEAVDKSRDSGIRQWGESSGGWWRWRHDPTVSVWRREGVGGLKWGEWWWMGGSHREAVETVALGREPERRRGLRSRVSARRTRRVVAGDFSSTLVVQDSEGKKEGPLQA
jgi:hypothetical protein